MSDFIFGVLDKLKYLFLFIIIKVFIYKSFFKNDLVINVFYDVLIILTTFYNVFL